jgi:peptide/nickel transport system permease protein
MTATAMDSALPARPSPWASRISVAAVHFFVLVLFLQNLHADTWLAILGLVVAHLYSVIVLLYWSNLERSTAGDTVIVALTLEFMLIAIIFWDRFSLWPWSTFFGLFVVQACALLAVRFWKGLRKAPPTAWFGLVVILLYVIIAATAPIIAPFTETEIVGSEYEAWGGQFLLGTDNLGRDWLTRLIYGARNTIGVAFITTCLAFVIGVLGGFLSAALGGWTDQILGRVVDVLMAIPSLIFALLLLSIFKDYSVFGLTIHPMVLLVVIIAVLDSTRVFRLARAVGMNIVVMDYVEVSRLRGEGLWWVITREVLPNAMPPLVAEFGLRFCFVFLFLSALSFLGLGIQPPTADWGSMVRDNATLISFGDITPLLPAMAIALLTIGVNFVVDWFLHQTSGLRDDH